VHSRLIGFQVCGELVASIWTRNRTDYLGTHYKAHCLRRYHSIGQGVLASNVGAASLERLKVGCGDQEGDFDDDNEFPLLDDKAYP
jgi:hypothetical protein